MLGKLIKYDLRWSIKLIAIFLGLGVIFTILGKIFSLIPDSLFFEIIAEICKGASVAMFANALFNAIFRSWARMNLNFYKDEAYLTHTLPIDRRTHMASKVISQIILITTTGLLLIIAIFIMYIDKDVFEKLKTMIEFASGALDTSVAWLLASFTILALLELCFIALCGNFGIVIGHMFNKCKMLLSVAFGIASYYIVNLILILIFIIISLFDSDMYAILFEKSEIMEFGLMMTVAYICIIVYILFNVALYFITNYLFRRGINIE